jgi:hypothetical protein
MMSFINFLKNLFKAKKAIAEQAEPAKQDLYKAEESTDKEIKSVWDILQFNENTQAFHLSSVIRFDEWVDMDEIRRRIMELFQINYENERSLYPYLKTLVDVGLVETNSIGGKRKWRKKDLLIKIERKKEQKEEIKVTAAQ